MSISFRDPSGHLYATKDRIVRVVRPDGQPDLLAFLNSDVARLLTKSGLVVETKPLDGIEASQALQSSSLLQLAGAVQGNAFFEHERVPFTSYPFEWPPQMLHAAGMLTLEIAERCLQGGIGLKDATPYNILFRGPKPVFVDLLSFEKRDPADSIWLAYSQFTRNFTLPLLMNRHLGVPLTQLFRVRRDGLEPHEAYEMLGPLRRLLPPFLSSVTIPTWLNRVESKKLYEPRKGDDPERAKFILASLLGRLRRTMQRLSPPLGESHWSRYMETHCSYTQQQLAVRASFVESSLEMCAPGTVLDVGCNTGFYSTMAAKHGARVVAIDSDPVVVGHVWQEAGREGLDVLPLVADISRPSPGLGWRNQECRPLLERLSGSFDTVLMLAVIHHLLVTERIPLPEIVDLAADICTRHALIEYIGPDDPMFQKLVRGRGALHQSLNRAVFETAWQSRFQIERTQDLTGSARVVYLLSKKS